MCGVRPFITEFCQYSAQYSLPDGRIKKFPTGCTHKELSHGHTVQVETLSNEVQASIRGERRNEGRI